MKREINIKYLRDKHKALVERRRRSNPAVAFTMEELKEIDREIGHLAAAFNDKVSEKALAWLEGYGK